MRPTWKGSISFGLVYIPISVYPATREEKLSFRQLRKTDLSPIKYKKVAEADMKEVPADQIVKGFVAKVVIANREYLAAVKPDGLFLVLELMHFASEVLTPEELTRPKTELNDKELKMANALIESMSSAWQPEKYRDEYRDAVMEMIETKAKNKALPAAPVAAPRTTNVVDLVKVLQESINRSQSGRVKRGGNGATGRRRSTSSLVRQKRRAAA